MEERVSVAANQCLEDGHRVEEEPGKVLLGKALLRK